jgi:hypothetical protein
LDPIIFTNACTLSATLTVSAGAELSAFGGKADLGLEGSFPPFFSFGFILLILVAVFAGGFCGRAPHTYGQVVLVSNSLCYWLTGGHSNNFEGLSTVSGARLAAV